MYSLGMLYHFYSRDGLTIQVQVSCIETNPIFLWHNYLQLYVSHLRQSGFSHLCYLLFADDLERYIQAWFTDMTDSECSFSKYGVSLNVLG